MSDLGPFILTLLGAAAILAAYVWLIGSIA